MNQIGSHQLGETGFTFVPKWTDFYHNPELSTEENSVNPSEAELEYLGIEKDADRFEVAFHLLEVQSLVLFGVTGVGWGNGFFISVSGNSNYHTIGLY